MSQNQTHSSARAPKPSFLRRVGRLFGIGRKLALVVNTPEPQSIGSFPRGRQLMIGNFQFNGQLVEAPGTSIWKVTSPSVGFTEELHRFTWLDDLAAVGDEVSDKLIQEWVVEWVNLYGRGKGPGWAPDLIGRRLLHLLSHMPTVIRALDAKRQKALYRSITLQANTLARTWPKTGQGLPRVEALVGLIYVGLSLEGYQGTMRLAVEALGESLADDVDNEGGIPSRCPEDLLKMLVLLSWALTALEAEDKTVSDAIWAAVERMVPTLRALRHVNGELARFHGGGRGTPGTLDKALVLTGIRTPATSGQAMGYATLVHGRSSVVIDAAAPPKGIASAKAHASTLAFELSAGNHPVVVNCGSGDAFGPDWAQACRASASHSTLSMEARSSSRTGKEVTRGGKTYIPLIQGPKRVIQQKSTSRQNSTISLSHDGYVATHGLTHLRQLSLSIDGAFLEGEDTLRAVARSHKAKFDSALDETSLQGIPYQLRFHLHPDSEAHIDLGGRAVSILLPNEDVWVFRPKTKLNLALEPSVYMDREHLKPRPAEQIVITGLATKYTQTMAWHFVRAESGDGERESPFF